VQNSASGINTAVKTEGICDQVPGGGSAWTYDKVTREWRKVHVEELRDLHVLVDYIRLT